MTLEPGPLVSEQVQQEAELGYRDHELVQEPLLQLQSLHCNTTQPGVCSETLAESKASEDSEACVT